MKLPKEIKKVYWKPHPTSNDSKGCDGIYVDGIELVWWYKGILAYKAMRKVLDKVQAPWWLWPWVLLISFKIFIKMIQNGTDDSRSSKGID